MELRNKKTGEIVPASNIAVGTGKDGKWYYSLAELVNEWEDYEEPKSYWFIGYDSQIESICEEDNDEKSIELDKQIGNYFETKEEAEKAVEKLKAITRLKSCGFKFKGWRTADLGADKHYFIITAESDGAGKGDLDLLFCTEDD